MLIVNLCFSILGKKLLESINLQNDVLQKIKLFGIENNYEVYLLRIDLIHPFISGNKWFKLKYNLSEAKNLGLKTILTFGGAFSNHIYSTAAAGKEFGFDTIGIIRGEEHLPLNPTLQFASDCGMKLVYINRSDYRLKHTNTFQEKLVEQYGGIYIVPEGGTNCLAVKGCSEIPSLINIDYDYICTACGTSGTISGVIAGAPVDKKIIGFSALKGGEFLINQTKQNLTDCEKHNFRNWEIQCNYHFGGYAKIKNELIYFVEEFEKLNSIPLDYIYTGKMMYGIYDLIKKGYFNKGSKIVALHTGGLQGNAGMKSKIYSMTHNIS